MKEKKQAEINFQNFPKREFKEIRNLICSPDDYLLLACDYGQLEVRVLTMASKDEKLIHDIWNNVDFHLQWSEKMVEKYPQILQACRDKILKLNLKKEPKPIEFLRSDIKNGLVFAWFYGAGKNSVAKHYEVNFGVPNFSIFELYEEFWDSYKGVKQWQKELQNFYNENGYVESISGRRRHMPLSINKIINQPIQSFASYDICICAGDRLSYSAYNLNRPQLQYRINVHDELVFFIPKSSDELDMLIIATEMVNPVYDCIIVPLKVEIKGGRNWGSLEEIAKLDTTEWWDYKGGGKWVKK
jgi:DNA polymerase-1